MPDTGENVWSSDSELHVALHELMHSAQYLQNPGQWTTLQLQDLSEAEKNLAFTLVSKYAFAGVIEFLAEVGSVY